MKERRGTRFRPSEREVRRRRAGRGEATASEADAAERAETVEARIDELYDQLRGLVERSAGEGGLRAVIHEKRRQLVALQEEEAELAERRARSRLRIQPGDGYRMLGHAEKLLQP